MPPSMYRVFIHEFFAAKSSRKFLQVNGLFHVHLPPPTVLFPAAQAPFLRGRVQALREDEVLVTWTEKRGREEVPAFSWSQFIIVHHSL